MPQISTITGHKEQLEQLQNDIDTDNVAHAYLFSGPKHVGKISSAFLFAHKLLCRESEDEKKCIQSIEKLIHPDLLVLDTLYIDGQCDDWNIIAEHTNVSLHHRKKSKAKTDTIGIDDVRALQDRLFETGIGKNRVCIIRSIERMQGPAANAFLKILEEPPKGLVFLLTTEALSSLLPTLISRSRVMRFSRLAPAKILPLLSGLSDDDTSFILSLSQGAPGKAILLMNDPDLLRAEKTIHTAAANFWREKSLVSRHKILKPLHKKGKEADQLLLHLYITLQKSDISHTAIKPLINLTRGLLSNSHRQLLVQSFAYSIAAL